MSDDTKQINLSLLLTEAQFKAASYEVTTCGVKSTVDYLNSQPDIVAKCAEHGVHIPYLAFWLEYIAFKDFPSG